MGAEEKKAEGIAKELLVELEAEIKGKKRAAWQCNCGCYKYGEAVVMSVVPGGRQYFPAVTMFCTWTVKMREVDKNYEHESHYSYVCGVSEFVDRDKLKNKFEVAFGDIDQDALYAEYITSSNA